MSGLKGVFVEGFKKFVWPFLKEVLIQLCVELLRDFGKWVISEVSKFAEQRVQDIRNKAAEHRQKAEQARAQAESATDPVEKEAFEREAMAAQAVADALEKTADDEAAYNKATYEKINEMVNVAAGDISKQLASEDFKKFLEEKNGEMNLKPGARLSLPGADGSDKSAA